MELYLKKRKSFSEVCNVTSQELSLPHLEDDNLTRTPEVVASYLSNQHLQQTTQQASVFLQG